jgi:hypothetical protein
MSNSLIVKRKTNFDHKISNDLTLLLTVLCKNVKDSKYTSQFLCLVVDWDGRSLVFCSVTITWLVNVWINWLPPVWVTLDLFLHHDDLKERHKLYFVCDDQSLKFVFILSLMKALWMFLSVPILVLIWRLVVANNLSVAYAVDANYSLLIPTLLLVNAISTLVLVLSVRGRLRRPETVKLLRD